MLPGTWLLPLELLCPSPCRRVRFQLRQVRAVLQLRQVHQVRPSSRDTGPPLSRGPPGARSAPSPPHLGHYGRPSPDRVARATQVTQWACASRCPPNLPETQSRLSSPGQTAPSNHRNVLEGDPERALLTLGGGRQPWQRGPRWRFLQGSVKTQQILSERTVNVQ